ncbi:S-locus receptor kinase (SRK) [Zostera marina]|uniref:Receptor-like serine/threonine-protein kinase n=1 Tax=Zostera marina TaxID=29655 RepID=A0A0K9NJ97_ZOSMR|nr:S-locus receptor kinase (SRK) [Zostera marina]
MLEHMRKIAFGGSLLGNSHRYVFFTFLLFILLSGLCSFGSAGDNLSQNETLTGNQTLVSIKEVFEFGFFNLSSRYYLGIWYHDILPRTIVWVANREEPFSNSSGFIGFRSGNLVVSGGVDSSSIWWSMDGGSNMSEINLTAQIKDVGNLVVSQQGGNKIWQSFDFPTDSFFSTQVMTLGRSNDVLTTLKPWKSDVDPSPGNMSIFLDPRGFLSSYFQFLIIDNPNTQMNANSTSIGVGDTILWRSGPWANEDRSFNGLVSLTPNSIYGLSLTPNDNGVQFTLIMPNTYDGRFRYQLLVNGTLTRYLYNNSQWNNIWSEPSKRCHFYNICGKNAICVEDEDTSCQCLFGFKPSFTSEWNKRNWSGGCVRNTTIEDQCQPSKVGFFNLTHVKTPDIQTFYRPVNVTASDSVCGEYCLKSCNCTAYVYMQNDGCYTWNGDLFDLQNLTRMSRGAKLSIKLNVTDLPPTSGNSNIKPSIGKKEEKSKNHLVVALVVTITTVLSILMISFYLWTKYKIKYKKMKKTSPLAILGDLSYEQQSQTDLLLLDFDILQSATNDFNESNTLGKGGFGHVYKGVLPGGEEIAVKRLSENSSQGVVEFKNEMILIAKLQHNNLVRMKGVCIQRGEKMLVYEYMPNGSLDDFIFNIEKQHLLDWKSRSKIMEGIARGLLYLHRDSRLRIIHRDLKAGNILLDEEMNPKISDFGMARIFGGKQNDQNNTNRVVGTFGYMSPEYAMEGLFSVKSDVYSFGIMILEIICGVKNNKFRTCEHLNLAEYVWQLWKEDRGMEPVDPTIKTSCSEEDVLRYEHVALLCVQDHAIDRPYMSDVVKMLSTEFSIPQIPKISTFTSGANYTSEENNPLTIAQDSNNYEIFSENEITMTEAITR